MESDKCKLFFYRAVEAFHTANIVRKNVPQFRQCPPEIKISSKPNVRINEDRKPEYLFLKREIERGNEKRSRYLEVKYQ